MGINFGDAPVQQVTTTGEVAPSPSGCILDLSKDSFLDLTKATPGLKKIKFAAGWDVASVGKDVDLDIAALMCYENGKIKSGSDVIYYRNRNVAGISLGEDNRTGAGEGDDEVMDIDLNNIPANCTTIKFFIVIFDAETKQQTFGMVNNAYARILNVDDNDKELCRFRLKDDYSTSTALAVAELRRNGSNWEFATIGEGLRADLNGIAMMNM